MNRRELLQGVGGLALAAAAPVAFAEPPLAPPDVPLSPRQDLLLDQGWRFHDGDIPFPEILSQDDSYDNAKAGKAWGAAAASFDDSEWPIVSLPHDFVSFRPLDEHANRAEGYRQRGIVWYRNVLRFETSDDSLHIELQIEGAATHATIWFNGNLIDHNWSGYNAIYADLTPFVTYGAEVNTLAIRIDATAMEGWWYEGGGLYRPVRIVKRQAAHIITDGVFAHPIKDDNGWVIPAEVTIANTDKGDRALTVELTLKDARGEKIVTRYAAVNLPSFDQAIARLDLPVSEPHVWSPDRPYLYSVETRLLDGGICLDAVTTTCGFRTQRFDAQKGFFLNDEPLKIKGVCLHQDHAGVGTAIADSLWDFRIRRLKALGCNAIRATHNAQSRIVLDLCDRYGLMVMNENRRFNPAAEEMEQLRWLVRRDRNHPAVILWSVFNEEPMQGSEAGFKMVERMVHEVKALDTSRPVTAAMNGGFFADINVAQAVDVVGFNYNQDSYDAFHARHPDTPLTSSEDTSAYSIRGIFEHDEARHLTSSYDDPPKGWATHRGSWKMIAERDFIAGGFVWTAFDYHGEPSPWGWPTTSSMYGIMDLCGFDKAAFSIHQAQWVPASVRPVLRIEPHWNWPDKMGQPVKVMVCTNLDEVELILNGQSLGRQKADPYEMNIWHVVYAPGRLEAIGYHNGQLAARTRVETTGKAVGLRIVPDRETVFGDGLDVVAMRIEAIDAHGRVVPLAQNGLDFQVRGGDITGLGNGDPNSLEPEKGTTRSLFNGLAQVIIQVGAQAQQLTLIAAGAGLKSATLTLKVLPKAPPARQPGLPSIQVLDYWYCAPEADSYAAAKAGMTADMTNWDDFGPRWLHDPQPIHGYTLVSHRYTPHAKVQREGGVIDFPSLTGVVDIFDGETLVGRKTDSAEGALSVPIAPGKGERRVNLLFRTEARQPFAFKQNVLVRQKSGL